MKKLTAEEKKNFLEWSEGNRYLYELLCSCWENGITTFASCGGHEQKNGSPYLGMIINDNSLPFIKNILAQIQDMTNIVISSGVRIRDKQLCPDEELRGLAFYAYNYNCCELFYKMRTGIEAKEHKANLSPKANRFYNMIKSLSATSREELQAEVNDNIVVGSTFSTKTQEFIDFQNSNKMAKNSKLARFFRRLLPFKKSDTTKYEKLQQKYGFLQRTYSGERSTKMEQYRVKLDNQSDDRKKEKDITSAENKESDLDR